MNVNMIKWRLMVTTIPMMVMVVLMKIILIKVFHFTGIVEFGEIDLVITGGIFLMGFMLAGTLADYKESEKIPSHMACAMESIEDTVVLAHGFKGDFDLSVQKNQLLDLTESIIQYFAHKETEDVVFAKIDGLTSIALHVEQTRMGSTTAWIKREQTNLRILFARTTVIKRTHFISTGYAFLEVLTLVIIGLMLVSRFENLIISIVLIGFITQIFIYMIRLIKDIDHPFEYPADGKVRAADIELFPLIEYHRRAKGRL